MKQKRKAKLKAASLAYSLLLILLISSISLSLILLNEYRLQFVHRSFVQSRLIDNSFSAINKLISVNFKHDTYSWKGDLFGSETDSVEAKLFYHGVFKVSAVKTIFRDEHYYNACFSGTYKDSKFGLLLEDSRYTLKVAGSTRLKGGLFIPKRKVEVANLNQHRYNGDKLFWGDVYESKKTFPTLDKSINKRLKFLESRLKNTSSNTLIQPSDTLLNSFHKESIIYSDTGLIRLNNVSLKGNIIVHSNKEVNLYANSEIENIVVSAPIVKVENGFEGKIQIIASDSLIIGEQVKLNFPSAIIANPKPGNTFQLLINENSLVEGVIIAHLKDENTHSTMHFEDDFKIHGSIYNPGQTIIKNARILGQLISGSVLYDDHGRRDMNLLLNVSIDPEAMPKHIRGMNFLVSDSKKEIFEWL